MSLNATARLWYVRLCSSVSCFVICDMCLSACLPQDEKQMPIMAFGPRTRAPSNTMNALSLSLSADDDLAFFILFFVSQTIFSAPHYCGEFDNAGGMMIVRDDLMCSFKVLKPK